jgi:hypothetical protein
MANKIESGWITAAGRVWRIPQIRSQIGTWEREINIGLSVAASHASDYATFAADRNEKMIVKISTTRG